MSCRKCGACCIAPSITTPIPNMPNGKPAGVRCANLSEENLCTLYGKPNRPAFCVGWKPAPEACGETFAQAMKNLVGLEAATA
ncbi:MAG: YkgJ family cysteine cluster protein [Sedimentisphaerales bacterium]|nr:YkgJ family cysteine cluster protein [Sedimentisphaerales bacterium]